MQNALSATPDGYTIGEMSADTLPFIAQGRTPFQLDDMQGICQLMDEPEVLFVNAIDDRFPDWDHFKKYAAGNRTTIATAGAGGMAEKASPQFKLVGLNVANVPEIKPIKKYTAIQGRPVDAIVGAAEKSNKEGYTGCLHQA